MSVDFTPENERERIRRLAEEQPTLLGDEVFYGAGRLNAADWTQLFERKDV